VYLNYVNEKFQCQHWELTHDLLAGSTVPEPTAPLHAPVTTDFTVLPKYLEVKASQRVMNTIIFMV